MRLVAQWGELESTLPEGWHEARIRIALEEPEERDRTAGLLAPLQPYRTDDGNLSFRVAVDGTGPTPEAVRRALERMDAARLHGVLAALGSSTRPAAAPAPSATTLLQSWNAALATLPEDWSDVLAEIELDSSDYLERAALRLAPLNPRRDGGRIALRFRCARRFGYGAARQMVERCLTRCDEEDIRGRVRILRALSDTYPVGTQGPVWQLDGRTV
jgi:hypothetical protein